MLGLAFTTAGRAEAAPARPASGWLQRPAPALCRRPRRPFREVEDLPGDTPSFALPRARYPRAKPAPVVAPARTTRRQGSDKRFRGTCGDYAYDPPHRPGPSGGIYRTPAQEPHEAYSIERKTAIVTGRQTGIGACHCARGISRRRVPKVIFAAYDEADWTPSGRRQRGAQRGNIRFRRLILRQKLDRGRNLLSATIGRLDRDRHSVVTLAFNGAALRIPLAQDGRRGRTGCCSKTADRGCRLSQGLCQADDRARRKRPKTTAP